VKNYELEILHKIFDKIPETFSIKLRAKILKNKFLIESEYNLIEELKKTAYTKRYIEYSEKVKSLQTERKENKISSEEFVSGMNSVDSEFSEDIKFQKNRLDEYKEYVDLEFSGNLIFINIDELPDDINELDAEFLEGLFLITI
jgi:hypothetical protein